MGGIDLQRMLDGLRRLTPDELSNLTSFARAPQVPWESLGPHHISGVIRQVVIDPEDRRRIYAVSANGGIWRLDNVDDYPHTQWKPLTDELDTLRFRVMVVSPSSSKILYAATSTKELRSGPDRVGSDVLRSNDMGGTWNVVSSPGMGVVHQLVADDLDTVLAATSTGLWRRLGADSIWQQLFKDDCLDVAVDPDDQAVIYLGVRAQGVYKSSDAGTTWSTNPVLGFNAGNAGADRELIRIALGRSNSDGSAQTPTNRTVVVRFGDEVNVSPRLSGAANTWQRRTMLVGNLAGGSIRRSDVDPRKDNEWCGCLALDPFNDEHILIGGVTILASSDAGQTWSQPGFPHHEDQHSLVFDDRRKGLVYCGNDGGLFTSIDDGKTWPQKSLENTVPARDRGTYLVKGLATAEFRRSAVANGRCLAAADHLGLIISEDLNDRWQFVVSGGGNVSDAHPHESSLVFACPVSADRWYVVNWFGPFDATGARGRLAQVDLTRTGGLIDTPARPFANYLSPRLLAIDNQDIPLGRYAPEDMVYNRNLRGPFAVRETASGGRLILAGIRNAPSSTAGYQVEAFWLSANGVTATHSELYSADTGPLRDPITALSFVPGQGNQAFAVTSTGTLFERDFDVDPGRSRNGPRLSTVATWTLPAGANFVSRLIQSPVGDQPLYLLTQNAIGRYNAAAGAVDTVHIWPDVEERLMALVAHPAWADTLFLGTSRGVWISENAGSDWVPYRRDMPKVPITDLCFDEGHLYASTFGRGLWRCTPRPPLRRFIGGRAASLRVRAMNTVRGR